VSYSSLAFAFFNLFDGCSHQRYQPKGEFTLRIRILSLN
jgi:hypothetical protein